MWEVSRGFKGHVNSTNLHSTGAFWDISQHWKDTMLGADTDLGRRMNSPRNALSLLHGIWEEGNKNCIHYSWLFYKEMTF